MHEYKNLDCLEYLKKLKDNSVDLILTDPPYFIGYDKGKGWDSQWKSDEEYLEEVLNEIEEETGLSVISLPMLEDYHIDLGFKLCF